MQTLKIGRRKATIWTLVFSYANIVYTIIAGLLMVPLYLRYIPVELYGAWLASGNILGWLMMVDPGLATVVQQRVGRSYGANNPEAVGGYALSGIILTCGIALLVVLAGWALSFYLSAWVNLDNLSLQSELRYNFIIAAAASAFSLLAYAVGAVNLGLQGSFAHGMVFLSANLASLCATFVMLLSGAGLTAIAVGLLVRSLVFFLGGIGYMLWRGVKDSLRFRMTRSIFRELLGLMTFTSVGRVGGVLSRNMDAFLLARFMGPEAVPIYVLTRRGFSVAEMLLNRTGNAIGPGLSHLSGEGNQEKMRSIITRLLQINLWMLGLALAGFIGFNDDFVRIWVGQQFFAGSNVSFVLCALMLASVLSTLMQTLCVALGDIKRNAVVQFGQALITFTLLVVGIYFFGFLGAAMAPLLGFLAVSSWYYPRSLGRMSFLVKGDWLHLLGESLRAGGIGLILGCFFLPLQPVGWFTFLLDAAFLVALYAASLVIISRNVRNELQRLKRQLLKAPKSLIY